MGIVANKGIKRRKTGEKRDKKIGKKGDRMVGEMENNGGKSGGKIEKKAGKWDQNIGHLGENGIKNGNLGFFDVFLRRICGFLR